MRKLFFFCALAALSAPGCSSTPTGSSPNERRADALLQAGVDSLERKSYSEALGSLLEANRFNPKSPEIWTDLGVAYAGKKDMARAEESWRKALQVDPKHTDARLNLGLLYMNSKHYPEAERILKEAAKDMTYHGLDQVAFQLAQIYFIQNKPLLAEQQLKIAVRENGSNCNAWLKLGMLQESRGDYKEASESMKGATMGVCYKNPRAHYE
ncbi:MAG: tetratricopeptide repeat protein, partial [Bdellovibrionota bacterium]